jgi:hypothetical protein
VSRHSETRTNHGVGAHGRGQDVEIVGGTEFLGFGPSHLFFFFLFGKVLCVPEAMCARACFPQNQINVVGRLDKGQLGCAGGLVKE